MLRKASGTNYIPKQAEVLQEWVEQKALKQELEQNKKFEILMDSIGQAITILAIVFGALLLVVNIPRLLGWW